MNAPVLSVVIPTYNRPALLRRALNSVLDQSFENFEVIIIDDGDGSAEVVVQDSGDPRIRYVKNDGPHGGGASRNLGIKESRGSFIAFLDDDDTWLSEKLRVQMERFSATPPEVGFSVTGVQTVRESGRGFNTVEDGVYDFSSIALVRFKGFLTSTLIVKRAVFDAVGFFDESLPSHQEAELLIRVTRKYKGLGINQPLTVLDMTPHEHIGSELSRRIRGREMVLEKHMALFRAHPLALAKHYFWLGLWYRDSKNKRKARPLFIQAFRLSWNPRYLVHAVLASI